MRIIKFRAWDTTKKKMRLVDRIDWLLSGEIIRAHCCLSEIETIVLSNGYNQEREDYILMQFTGLHDKKGKEICEGDIVKVTHPQGDEPFNGEVFFAPDGMWRHTFLEGRPSKAMWEYAEVIGNIYENPELLK